MTQTPHSPLAGHAFALGRYVLTGRIATGGMATVYRARIQSAGVTREFAIKVLHPHLAEAKNVQGRFLDEARIASRISHPNVVSTLDVGSSRGYKFLVLELIHGVTLRQLQLHRPHCPRLLATDAARIVADAARGLHAVHTARDEFDKPLNVVHRDVSPHNLMLDTRGRTVLIDLGLSKSEGQECHTQTGVLCGKLPYMSPEQSLLATLDARSDIFSLGSVLFELCTGELPFGDAHAAETLTALRTCDHDKLRSRLDDCGVPAWTQDVILRCLAVDPDQRFASAIDLADTLEGHILAGSVEHLDLRRRLAALALEAKMADANVDADCDADAVRPLACIALPTPGTHVTNLELEPEHPSSLVATTDAQSSTAKPSVNRGPAHVGTAQAHTTVAKWLQRHSPAGVIDGARWVALGAALALITVGAAKMLRADEAATDEGLLPLAAGLAADTAIPLPTEAAENRGPSMRDNEQELLDGESATGDSGDDADVELSEKRKMASKRQRRRVLHRGSKVARKLRGNPYQD